MSNILYLGIDQGFSKTAIAITDELGNILFESTDAIPILEKTNEEKHLIRIQRLLLELNDYKSNVFDVYIASNGYLSGQWKEILESNGISFHILEFFNDTHAHYGLTEMPGNCFTLASGSYFNLMYYDIHNNVSFFGFHNSFDPGLISGFGFGNLLLELWVKSHFEGGTYSELAMDVEEQIGYAGENVYTAITRLLKEENKALIMDLAKLLPKYVSKPEIKSYINQAILKIAMAMKVFIEYLKAENVKYLFVGGSMWKYDFLLEFLRKKMNDLQIAVIRAEGNPATGAIRFRVNNPTAYIKTW